MALDAATAQQLIQKLADDRAANLDTLTRAYNLLAEVLLIIAGNKPSLRLTEETIRQNTGLVADAEGVPKGLTFSVDDEPFFVQQTLPTREAR